MKKISQSSILCDVFLIAYILAHKKYYVKMQKYGIKYPKNEILNSTTTFGGGIYSRTVKVYSFI